MVRNARIKITIDGTLRPYTDGRWVIFTPSGWPTGFMLVERKHLKKVAPGRHMADDQKAFADFWAFGQKSALGAALEGYTIQLVTAEKSNGLLTQHFGQETEAKKERQHGEDPGA